jgi:hypothetical protein
MAGDEEQVSEFEGVEVDDGEELWKLLAAGKIELLMCQGAREMHSTPGRSLVISGACALNSTAFGSINIQQQNTLS